MNMKKLLSLCVLTLVLVNIVAVTSVSAKTTGETIIQGNIDATGNINVSYTPGVTFTINESGEFVCSAISVVNNSTFPIEMGFSSYIKSSVMNDILKNDEAILGPLTGNETDADLRVIYARFGKSKSQNISLNLKDSITSQYIQNFIEDEIPFATLSNQITENDGFLKKGILAGGGSVSFELNAFHGLAFADPILDSRTLGYEFRLAD